MAGPSVDAVQDDIEMRATGKPREEAAKAFDALMPHGRHTTPEEIGRGYSSASRRERKVTSRTFAIDGGMSDEEHEADGHALIPWLRLEQVSGSGQAGRAGPPVGVYSVGYRRFGVPIAGRHGPVQGPGG